MIGMRMRNINKVKFCLFPFVFVLVLVLMGMLKSRSFSNYIGFNPTVITQVNKFNDIKDVELLEGEKVVLRFEASSNRLGIVSMRFNIHNRVNHGLLRFKIKESISNDWYYVNDYEISKFQDSLYFPFGFPEITKSKGKEYVIEIESVDGVIGNSVQLLAVNNSFLSKYSYSKEYLLQNKREIPIFLFSKLFSLLKSLSIGDYLLAIIFSIFIINIFNFFKKAFYWFSWLVKNIFLWFKNNLKKDPLILFLVILLLTILSRYVVSYRNSENLIQAPESLFYLSPVGRDLFTGVVLPANNLLNGRNFVEGAANYGTGIVVTFAPLLSVLKNHGVCSFDDVLNCHITLYKWYLFLFFLLFLIFIWICFLKVKSKNRLLLLLFVSIFSLQLPFAFGVERGNLDLFLFVLIGFLFYFSLKIPVKNRILRSLFIGFLVGYISNVKFFLLPFAIIEILFSGSVLVSLLSFLFSFIAFSYLPVLYGVSTDIFSIWNGILLFNNGSNGNFSQPFYLVSNHSIKAISTLFTGCVNKGTCLIRFGLVSFISKFWLLFVFVLPFIHLRKKNIFKMFSYLVLKKRELYILLYILSCAVINLIPNSVYAYRLLYSIPIMLVLLTEVDKDSKEKVLFLKSVLCFMVAGLWFCYYLSNGFSLFDVRVKNIFILLHFYYLIKLGLEKTNEKK